MTTHTASESMLGIVPLVRRNRLLIGLGRPSGILVTSTTLLALAQRALHDLRGFATANATNSFHRLLPTVLTKVLQIRL